MMAKFDGSGGVGLIWAVLILGVRLEEILLEKLTAESNM